ncbi:hypothetical protein ACIA8G_09320 [Lentzea sp. NPDC051213]|uniref:hypothetical protein n=1 Tax=Lentzea sp. NPDC051213 TaxID=3364126 RepID=UPI0037946C7B
MNRSVERQRFFTEGVRLGEICVGSFTHPVRGRVRSSASPLVAGTLRRLGHQVREVSGFTLSSDATDGVLFTASYVDRSGAVVGFGAAAHHADEQAVCAAREAVHAWSAVWRTRRVVLATAQECTADDCPAVGKALAELKKFADRGDRTVIIGIRDSELAAVLTGTGDAAVVAESPADVAALDLDPDHVSYLVQPGLVVEDAVPVITALRARYPRLRGAHPDNLCYATSDRMAAVLVVAMTTDRLLVCDSGAPDEAARLVRLVASTGRPAHVVRRVDDILPSWMAGTESVGVAAVGHFGTRLVNDVVGALSGLGPMSLVRRRVSTGVTTMDTLEPTAGAHPHADASHAEREAPIMARQGRVDG